MNIMITALLAFVPQKTLLPVEILEPAGYQFTTDSTNYRVESGSLKESTRLVSTDGSQLYLHISACSEESHTLSYAGGFGSSKHIQALGSRLSAVPTFNEAASRIPLGLSRGYYDPRTGYTLVVDTKDASIRLSYVTKMGHTSNGFVDPEPFDLQTKSAFVERIARHTLANAAGLRLDDAGVGVLAGRSVKKAKCRRSNRVFGRVDEWADGEGWSFAEDKFYGIINLKKGSKWAVLPLGADQIKVNGVWKEMGDSAAFLNGKLYLPEAGLKHLKDAG